jgi:multicomponent Na+:H+ antiporter subunit E
VKRFLPLLLLGLWLLAWGEVTVANVVSGVALIVVLFLVFPSGRGTVRVHVRPIGMLRLLGYVVGQLAVSNVLVAREIVSRRSRVRTGVIEYRLEQPSDLTITLVANILALTPGTMPVDVTHDPPTIRVHFLLLYDREIARRSIGRLERLVVAAVQPRPETAIEGPTP